MLINAARTVPLYFIGENLPDLAVSPAERDQWEELLRFRGPLRPASDPVVAMANSPEGPVLNQSFGEVTSFAYGGHLQTGAAMEDPLEVAALADGAPVMVVHPGLPENPGPRRITQNFYVASGADRAAVEAGRMLFLNGVCWLLHCAECQAFDLRLNATVEPEEARVGEVLEYKLEVVHSGECQATNVLFTDILPANTTLLEAGASQGSWTYDRGQLRFRLGTMTNGAIATIHLSVVAHAEEMATNVGRISVFSAGALGDNSSAALLTRIWPARPMLQMTPRGPGEFELKVTGPPGHKFRLEKSGDLLTWEIVPVAVEAGLPIPFTETNSGAGFFRVSEE